MTTTQTTEYLATYTGTGGPITAIFQADDLDAAIAISRDASWFDEARTDLEDEAGVELMDADSDTIHATAIEQGWARVYTAVTDRDYSIYARA